MKWKWNEQGFRQPQKTQNIYIKFVQYWTNVKDVRPTLYRCYTNVFAWTFVQEPKDVEMNEMTLPSRHRIRNPQYWIPMSERRRNIFFLWKLVPERDSNPRSPTFQASSFNHCTSAAYIPIYESIVIEFFFELKSTKISKWIPRFDIIEKWYCIVNIVTTI